MKFKTPKPLYNIFTMILLLFATIIAAIFVGGLFNVIIILLFPMFGITESSPSTIEWYTGSIGLFGGLIAACAIYFAIGQGNELQAKTQKLLANEKRYDDKMLEINRVVDTVNEFITKICRINVEDRFYKPPKSKQDFDVRKAYYKSLHKDIGSCTYYCTIISTSLLRK